MTPDAENAVVSPILPFLYLGNEKDAQDQDLLRRLNIGYVVNVTTHLPLYHVKSGLRYKRLPATDNSKQNLRQYFEEGFEFIGRGRTLFSWLLFWLDCRNDRFHDVGHFCRVLCFCGKKKQTLDT